MVVFGCQVDGSLSVLEEKHPWNVYISYFCGVRKTLREHVMSLLSIYCWGCGSGVRNMGQSKIPFSCEGVAHM